MKRIFTLFAFLLLLSSYSIAQTQISVFAGYGMSSFEDDLFDGSEFDQSGYIPVGATIQFGRGMFKFGGEISYSVLPFTFEMSAGNQELAEVKFTQLYYGAFVKIKFGEGIGTVPYLRAGGGYYTGRGKIEYADALKQIGYEDEEEDFKGVFGFNGGGGVEFSINQGNSVYFEFLYHFVDQEMENDDSDETFKLNNWALQVGFLFGL